MRKLMHGVHHRNFSDGLNRTQHRTLFLLYNHGPSSMGEISLHLDLEKGSFTPVVSSLIEGGYVHRERDKKDRRRLMLSITGKGEKLVKKIEEMICGELEKKIGVLAEEDKIKFVRAVDDLYSILEKL
jgi:DNA-binding MarR family transcriptional regulator